MLVNAYVALRLLVLANESSAPLFFSYARPPENRIVRPQVAMLNEENFNDGAYAGHFIARRIGVGAAGKGDQKPPKETKVPEKKDTKSPRRRMGWQKGRP